MIEFSCGKCDRTIRAKDELAGRRIKCPQCQTVLGVPGASKGPTAKMPTRSAAPVEQEVTEHGDAMYRHDDPDQKRIQISNGDERICDAITAHTTRYFGEAGSVFHELFSLLVHIDVHIVEPTQGRPFYTLITSGMSEKAMTVPPEARDLRYAELMLCLPADWPMKQDEWDEHDWAYWPIHTLKFLARFPHQYETWFGPGHTIPNGDPPEHFAPNTELCSAYLTAPRMVPQGAHQLPHPDGGMINLYAIVPLYEAELEHKLKHGADSLEHRFEKSGITELLDINRKNVCKKRFGLF